jgi:hypothetical protein
MKSIYLVIIIALSMVLLSCKKETFSSTSNLMETVDTTAILKYSGDFSSGPYGSVTGTAEVYQIGPNFQLKLSGFNTTNGPDLHVYLSQEAMPVSFIDLGQLKSTNGNQVYDIAGMPNFSMFKYISIHCVAYNHLFGAALFN